MNQNGSNTFLIFSSGLLKSNCDLKCQHYVINVQQHAPVATSSGSTMSCTTTAGGIVCSFAPCCGCCVTCSCSVVCDASVVCAFAACCACVEGDSVVTSPVFVTTSVISYDVLLYVYRLYTVSVSYCASRLYVFQWKFDAQ